MKVGERQTLKKSRPLIAVWAAGAANLAIAISKFTASHFTGSAAMFAEGIHSLVDTGNELFLIIGKRRSEKPADDTHPFGYGREIYFWTLLVGIMIFALGGAVSFYEGVIHLLHPEPIKKSIWKMAVLGASILFEGSSLLVGIHEYRKHSKLSKILGGMSGSDEPTTFAVVIEDSVAITGLLIAVVGVFLSDRLGNPNFDAAASLFIGLLLMAAAIFMIREAKELLIGEGVSRKELEQLKKVILDDQDIEQVYKVSTTHTAPREVILALDLRFTNVAAENIREASQKLAAKIIAANPFIKHVYIEAHPLT